MNNKLKYVDFIIKQVPSTIKCILPEIEENNSKQTSILYNKKFRKTIEVDVEIVEIYTLSFKLKINFKGRIGHTIIHCPINQSPYEISKKIQNRVKKVVFNKLLSVDDIKTILKNNK